VNERSKPPSFPPSLALPPFFARPSPCRAAAGARRARHKSSFHASALGRASRIVDHATADETAAKKLALDVTALRRGWGSGE